MYDKSTTFFCSFKHESSVFEPDLFDIYLSYCQKSNSYKSKQTLPTGATPPTAFNINPVTYAITPAGPQPTSVGMPTLQPPHMFPPQAPSPASVASVDSYVVDFLKAMPTHLKTPLLTTSSHESTVTSGSDIPSGTTHVVSDKGSHTIYDFELQLLLDSSKRVMLEAGASKSSSGSKSILDYYPTYQHGSFLLYNQRGLLETLPLSYTCVSVTGNATVLEPSIFTLPHMPECQPPQGPEMAAIPKSSGYKYPISFADSVDANQSMKTGSSVPIPDPSSSHPTCPMPQILANISPTPKELMMQIQSLKSGVAYSAVLKFVQPVLLTDISIPSTINMSSVSIDVWLRPDDQMRVAQSSEVKTRSLMLGMLSPPPICQYVKVRCGK